MVPYDAQTGIAGAGGWLPVIQSPDGRSTFTATGCRRGRATCGATIHGYRGDWSDPRFTDRRELRFVSKPDYRALALYAPGFDAVWAAEYRQALEALLRNYAADIGRYADLGQEMTLSQMFRVHWGIN
jgi:hypothetical protein